MVAELAPVCTRAILDWFLYLPRLICQTGVKAGFFVGCILAKSSISPRSTVFEFNILAFKKEDLIEQLFPQYKLLLL
jgi:hypothetical protein